VENGQVAEKVVEEFAGMTEDVANHLHEVAKEGRELDTKALGFLGFGIVVGFGLGYFTQKKRLEKMYVNMALEEINRMREHYLAKVRAAEPKPSIDEVTNERISREEKYTPEEEAAIAEANARFPAEEEVEDEEEVQVVEGSVSNVFERRDTGHIWDYSAEMKNRTPHKPYVIHYDEFHESNNEERSQEVYTYYEGDEVLADTRDTVIENVDDLIGLENLARFGHGSHDVNVVYIRNERISMDMEINKHDGKFSVEVLGFQEDDPGMQHSARRRRRELDDE
jgi:hypothetical protein